MEPLISIHERSVGSTALIISAESLLSMERLDRSSPELWPERIPGIEDYSARAGSSQKLPLWKREFDDADYAFLHGLAKMSPTGLVAEVKKLFDAAYQLGSEEGKEMTRGKYLQILTTNSSQKKTENGGNGG